MLNVVHGGSITNARSFLEDTKNVSQLMTWDCERSNSSDNDKSSGGPQMMPFCPRYFVIFEEPAYTSMNSNENAIGRSGEDPEIPNASSSSKGSSSYFQS